jgi:hypothetical protein
VATPSFVSAEDSTSITLSGPNERDEPMTGFAVTVPSGFEIVHAHPVEGWEAQIAGTTASWSGGALASGTEATFGLEVEAETEPGVVQLHAEQGYPGGKTVQWQVALTVLPATAESSEHFALAGVIGILGLVVLGAVAALFWRRRAA